MLANWMAMATYKLHWDTADDEEITLRIRPLREHWEARGPGLLGRLRMLLPWLDIPTEVTVRLIQPKVGGAGRVLSRGNIEFEAVLANALPMLPEVVRLGWLIACSALETDEQESLALIPPTIVAAEYVELARFDETTVASAVNHWDCLEMDPTKLLHWWTQHAEQAKEEASWKDAIRQL